MKGEKRMSAHDRDGRRRHHKLQKEVEEYLAKKAQKMAWKVAKKLKPQSSTTVYCNDSNRFGDNLKPKFIWRKKIERDFAQGVPLDSFSVRAQKQRQKERMAEIEKMKGRREERALEKALARERASARAEFQGWEKKEETYEEDSDHGKKDVETLSLEYVMKNETYEAEEAGSFSRELIHCDECEEEAIYLEEDRAMLERKPLAVLEEQQRLVQAMATKLPPSEVSFEMKAMKAMGAMEEGDALFGLGAEVNLDYSQVYWWHGKYRPRKPKYFNRVHTGYEWNKYNRTHYVHDNPPPKIVQGYKFNIFYPDLVDNTKAPTLTMEKDGNSDETCIIRFHAGPPYEDVAFRIVNKEWEYSHKKGFKCTFEHGILHIYFNFKRFRYRR